MVKYVNYGNSTYGTPMYVITMYRTDHGYYKVEVLPCDMYGKVVSYPVVWDMFLTWWEARRYVKQQYKEFHRYVNNRQ